MGGGGFLGKVTDFVGLTDYSGAEERQNQATEAVKSGTDASIAMFRENIAFQTKELEYQREQYNDWKNIYGDVQENLGEYYKNLSGSTLASKALQAQAVEYNRAATEVTQQLAQRGLSGSGTEAAARTALASQGARQRAQIRAGADEMANQQKMAFLGLGLGQGTQMLGTQAQQAGTVGQGFNTMGQSQLQGAIAQGNIGSAYAQGTQSGSFGITGAAIGALGSAAGGYLKGKA